MRSVKALYLDSMWLMCSVTFVCGSCISAADTLTLFWTMIGVSTICVALYALVNRETVKHMEVVDQILAQARVIYTDGTSKPLHEAVDESKDEEIEGEEDAD